MHLSKLVSSLQLVRNRRFSSGDDPLRVHDDRLKSVLNNRQIRGQILILPG